MPYNADGTSGSDVATRLATNSGNVYIGGSDAPAVGQSLLATAPDMAEWATVGTGTTVLIGMVTGPNTNTVIAPAVITNGMLAEQINNNKLVTLTQSSLVANSATTATAANTDGAIVARDNTGGTNVGLLNVNGNLNFTGFYRNLSISGGNSNGYLYANFPALGDGVYWGYNCYYPFPGTTPVIPSPGGGTSRISVQYGSIKFGTGAVNTAPTNYWDIGITGNLSSLNSAVVISNLVGNVTGNVSGSAASFTGSLAGMVNGTQGATVIGSGVITNAMVSASAAIADTKLATIATAGKVDNSATTATPLKTNLAIVARNGSGAAALDVIGDLTGNVLGNVTGNLLGNVTGNVSGSAASFTGSLAGMVNGTQGATTITAGVITNAMVSASAAIADTKLATITTAGKVDNSATTATASNIINTIVSRDNNGDLSANNITANLIGNVSGSAASFTGSLGGVVTGTQSATTIGAGAITNTMLAVINTPGKVSNAATTATASNTDGAIVSRDNTGGTNLGLLNVYGNLNFVGGYRVMGMGGGNSDGYMYGNFPALGDGVHWGYNCYYPSGSTTPVIPSSGGSTSRISVQYGAITFATGGVNLAPVDYWNIDTNGNLSALNSAVVISNLVGNVSGSAASFTGSLAGMVIGTQGATTITAGVITNAMVSASAAIADTKLATITTAGKVDNSATTATAANTANAIVARDGSGNVAVSSINFGNDSLSNYSHETLAGSFSGPWVSSANISIYVQRIGSICNMVIFPFPIAGVATNTSAIYSLSLGSGFRPFAAVDTPVTVYLNSNHSLGNISISTLGSIIIRVYQPVSITGSGVLGAFKYGFGDSTNAIPGGTTFGWNGIHISYLASVSPEPAAMVKVQEDDFNVNENPDGLLYDADWDYV